MRTKLFVVSALAVAFFMSAPPVEAAWIRTGDVTRIGKSEVVKGDVYTSAGNVSLDGQMQGDVFAVGGTVRVGGSVAQSIFAAGGTVDVSGTVGDDVRVAGGTVVIDGTIEHDLLMMGGNVLIQPGALIKGDVFVAGGMLTMDGKVQGNMRVAAGTLSLNGTVQGFVVADIDQKLQLGKDARLEKDLVYRSRFAVVREDGAVVRGRVEQQAPKVTMPKATEKNVKTAMVGAIVFALLGKLLLALVMALVIVSVFKRWTKLVVDHARHDFWWDAFRGLVTMIVTPIVIVLLLASILGLPVGFAVLAVYSVAMMAAYAWMGVIVGAWLWKWITKKEAELNWKPAVVGTIVVTLVGAIPVIGWLFAGILCLATMGAMVASVQPWWEKGR
ncbi:MAG: hypothetical protein WCV84_05205 [Patescibacteria group bacterium]